MSVRNNLTEDDRATSPPRKLRRVDRKGLGSRPTPFSERRLLSYECEHATRLVSRLCSCLLSSPFPLFPGAGQTVESGTLQMSPAQHNCQLKQQRLGGPDGKIATVVILLLLVGTPDLRLLQSIHRDPKHSRSRGCYALLASISHACDGALRLTIATHRTGPPSSSFLVAEKKNQKPKPLFFPRPFFSFFFLLFLFLFLLFPWTRRAPPHSRRKATGDGVVRRQHRGVGPAGGRVGVRGRGGGP